MRGVKRGLFDAEKLQLREQHALRVLREFDRGRKDVDETVDAVMDYSQYLVRGSDSSAALQEKALASTRAGITRTLEDRPWKNCGCAICRSAGVEVIIFRGSNRNKRRGFHNLGVYHRHLQRTLNQS
jgi:hypothetical protein